MRRTRPPHGYLLASASVLGLTAAAVFGLGRGSDPADAAEKLVASSVCEAHELRALQAENPALELEIPAQFDTPWPPREACLSHAAAEDPEGPGGSVQLFLEFNRKQ